MVIEKALEKYAAERGAYPEALEDLLMVAKDGAPFLAWERLPLDPWARPYGYARSGDLGQGPRIVSYGSDGRPGGKGDARDIDNFMVANNEL